MGEREQEMKFSLTWLALNQAKQGKGEREREQGSLREKIHFVPLSYMEKSISDMSKQDKQSQSWATN